ncbi:MAG: protein kinase [Pirellulales bacterium]|nr:protein kinase [Pirellulales bacterium]
MAALERLGPYRIGRKLGRGGMGTVYAAEALDTGIIAAVKVLSAALGRDDGFRERFEAEIDTLRKLRHPNIVRLYGFGEEDGLLFYGMELVDGASLEDELQAGRRFNWREVLQISIKLCRALRHAHDRGIIHRDIKPANLLLSTDGEIKLSDFGIAKLFGHSGMTADGGVIGTAEYMAPEQADGRPVTNRCDLYSLGCVMYALCAGRPPFRARSLPEMLHMQRYAEPEPLRTFAPEAPVELEQIVADLLVKEPDRRIPTAMVLARRLEAMEHGLLRRERRSELDAADVDNEEFTYTPNVPLDATLVGTQVDAESSPPPEQQDELGFELRSDDDLPPTRIAPSPHQQRTLAPGELPSTGHTESGTVQLVGAEEAGPGQPTMAAPVGATKSSLASPAKRFTSVEETEDVDAPPVASRGPLISPQTVLLLGALVSLAAGAWYFLQPPTADALYRRILLAAASDKSDALSNARPDIDEFLARYPNDNRAPELRGYRAEIDLEKLERQFQRRPRGGAEELSPVERAYATAIRAAELDPELGITKLQALLAVYGDDAEISDRGRQCLELAERQLDRLQADAPEQLAANLEQISRQLARAEAIESSDVAKARSIYAGVVELYGDKTWARDEVARARLRLEQLPKAP